MLQKDFFRETIDDIHSHPYTHILFPGRTLPPIPISSTWSGTPGQEDHTATSTNARPHPTDEAARRTVESGLDRLIISIDWDHPGGVSAIQVGGKLDKVIEGTRNIIKWKKELGLIQKPFVIFQFLVVKPNEHADRRRKEIGQGTWCG